MHGHMNVNVIKCGSPLGQTLRGQARINFIAMATWPPTRSRSLTPDQEGRECISIT